MMGIPVDAEFVCIHARDPEYLQAKAPAEDWSYHHFRNADIDSLKDAVQYLTDEGLYVIRLGEIVEKPFAIEGNERVIDYASEYRTDFMDIYLMAKCLFLLATPTGVAQVSTIFGRPVAMTNWTHLELMTCFREGDLFIPKLHIKDGEELTLQQIINSNIGRFTKTEYFADNGISLIDSTPPEILALTMEMYMRLKGEWHDTAQMKDLQTQFRRIIHHDGLLCQDSPVMLGMHFAITHKEFLI